MEFIDTDPLSRYDAWTGERAMSCLILGKGC